MALAVIEHWFMILPIPAEALWRWSLKKSEGESREPGSYERAPTAQDSLGAASRAPATARDQANPATDNTRSVNV
jgi:hypothetical protein